MPVVSTFQPLVTPARCSVASLIWLAAACSILNHPQAAQPDRRECAGGGCEQDAGPPPCGVRCSPHASCEAADGGARCVCAAGYLDVDDDGTDCQPARGCSNIECGPGRACGVIGDTVGCVCTEGYEPVVDDADCRDVDECTRGLDDCDEHAFCINELEGYSCECERGYEGDGRRCRDVDECESSELRCGEHALCVFVPGISECRCELGYEGNPRAGCRDTDECEQSLLRCPERAVCTALPGPDRCICRGYYTDTHGDGSVCAEDRISLAVFSGAQIHDLFLAAAPRAVGGEERLAVASEFRGELRDFCGSPLQSKGKYDIALAVFGADDRCLWARSFGSTETDRVVDVGIDAEGNLFLLLHASGPVEIDGQTLGVAEGASCSLIKFDPNGGLDWSLPVSSCSRVWTYDDGPIVRPSIITESLAIDGAGDVYLLFGSLGGELGGLVLAEHLSYTAVVAKVSRSGMPLWAFELASDTSQAGAGVTQGHYLTADSTGNTYLLGSAASEASVALPDGTQLGAGLFLLALDPQGGLRWTRPWPEPIPAAIAAADDGVRLLLTGPDNQLPPADAIVHALHADGGDAWLAPAAHGGLSRINIDLKTGADGDVIVSGTGPVPAAADESVRLHTLGLGSCFVARLDRDANALWGHLFPGRQFWDLAVSPSGKIYVAGFDYSVPADFGGGIETDSGSTFLIGLRP